MFFLCWIADCILGRFHHIPGNFANPKCSVVQFKIGFLYKIQSLPLFSHCAGVAMDTEVGRGLSALSFFISPLSNMSVEILTSTTLPPRPRFWVSYFLVCQVKEEGDKRDLCNWRREWQTTSVFLPCEPHEQYEKAK